MKLKSAVTHNGDTSDREHCLGTWRRIAIQENYENFGEYEKREIQFCLTLFSKIKENLTVSILKISGYCFRKYNNIGMKYIEGQ